MRTSLLFLLRWLPYFDVTAVEILVTFFARVLHDSNVRPERPRFSNSPGFGVGFRIVNRECVFGVTKIDALEGLNDSRFVAKWMSDGIDADVAVDIAGVDHHRVAFP